MKRKEFWVVNSMIIIIVIGFALLTAGLSANQSVGSLAQQIATGDPIAAQINASQSDDTVCNPGQSALPIPAQETDPQLVKLAAYQRLCTSFVSNRMMFFTAFPQDETAAQAMSAKLAPKLKEYAAVHVQPLVIAEPYVGDNLMQYSDFMNGTYDNALSSLFADLKQAGVTDQMMGTWVPFPESNTPSWANKDTQPEDFASCVNRYLRILKRYFPGASGSILLDAETYSPNDTNWNNGDYLDLAPYLQGIDHTLVTSLGIEGFPWVSRASLPRQEIFKASEFLQPDLVINAARELRTRDIWLNTGTFAAKYTNDPKNKVVITPDERSAILNDILTQADAIRSYQQNQYRVSINLFSEDKSYAAEATDWSYWQDIDNMTILKRFLERANQLDLPVSIFDQTH